MKFLSNSYNGVKTVNYVQKQFLWLVEQKFSIGKVVHGNANIYWTVLLLQLYEIQGLFGACSKIVEW